MKIQIEFDTEEYKDLLPNFDSWLKTWISYHIGQNAMGGLNGEMYMQIPVPIENSTVKEMRQLRIKYKIMPD